MTRLRIFLFRLSALVRSRQMDREMDDEIASHLAEAEDEYIQQGLSPADARHAALRLFGGVTRAKELHRELRSLRSFRSSPTWSNPSSRCSRSQWLLCC